MKKIILPLIVLLTGIFLPQTLSWADGVNCSFDHDFSCPAGEECVAEFSDSGNCCLPTTCTASDECGSSAGFDNCDQPCNTATPGTCPGSTDNPNQTTCDAATNTCICVSDGSCNAYPNGCGSSAGTDNCGTACNTATPGICPAGEACGPNFNCVVNCPFLNSSCSAAEANNVPTSSMSRTPDPVNIATGEDYFSSTDFSISAQGPKLQLLRQYRSFSTFSGLFGYGWRTDFDLNLTQDGNGNVKIYKADGTELDFAFSSDTGTYMSNMGNYYTLVQNSDNSFTMTDKNGIIYDYDPTGRLVFVEDRNFNFLSFAYNPSVPGGAYIQDTNGRKIVLNIDTNGHIISAIDPAGKTYQYGYDPNGNLSSVTDPTGAVTNYTYDGNHKIIQFTNANSHNTYYQYDPQGRCTMTYRDNNVNKMSLNYEANNTTVVTDSLNNSTTYVFNSIGLLISKTDPLNNVTQQSWDNNMNLLSVTDARNNTTSYAYDEVGNLTQVTDPLNNNTYMSYTPDFNLISTKTDALNNTTTFNYDNNGNLTSVIDPLTNTHYFTYDQYGNILTVTDSRGNSTNFTYDAFGNVLQKTDALKNATNFTYE